MRISGRFPLAARRSFRLALTVSLALAVAYGLGLGLPFIAPLFAVILGSTPARPPGLKQCLGLIVAVIVTLGVGILLGPLLQYAPVAALLIIASGLFFSNRLAIEKGKGAIATLMAFGLTVIPAASSVSQALASALIAAMVVGILVTVVCQWVVYPLFPEDEGSAAVQTEPGSANQTGWLSLRATLIVLPAFMLTLTNPAAYLPLTVKSILLGREASELNLRDANREIIGSTLLGGLCAIAVWGCLSVAVELWFFFGWMLLFSLLLASGAYGALRTRLAPSFWIATLTTMIILLGSAVQDSANGKDVYQAFAVRMALFVVVAMYAGFAMSVLERLRAGRHLRWGGQAIVSEVN